MDMDFQYKKNPISKPINNPYQKDLERVASSFYVSNLPNSLDAKGLWNACVSYGHLVDAYIANKRSIGARYQRKNQSGTQPNHHVPVMNSNPKNYQNPNVVPSQTPIPPITKPLFASVLHPKKATPAITPLVIPVRTTSLKDQDFITIEDSSTVILLKVKDVESMGNIYAIYKNAGFLDLSTNNVEGLWIWIQFPSSKSCLKFQENTSLKTFYSIAKSPYPSFKVDEPEDSIAMSAGRMCIATKSHKHISEKVLVEDTSSNIDVNKVVKDAEVANSVEDDSIDDLNDLNENLNNLGHDFMDMENLDNAFPVQPDTLIKEENFAQHEIQKDEEDLQTKSTLWNKLADFMHNHNGKFILYGDLNVVRNEQEKFGSIFSSHKAGHFNAFIDSSGLIDLPIGGCYYTWMNKAGTKLSKLDCYLISDDILEAIPDIHIIALDHLWSDHTPILFHVKKSNFGPSLFKLYNSWLLRDGFDDLIRSTWSSMENHSNDRSHMSHEKLRSIKASIKQWHNNIKINDRNKRLEALNDLKFIDKKIDEGSANENDHENRIKLLQDIDNLDNLEAYDLIQKAHIKWDIEGDENSNFFHGIINQKRRSQSITNIMHDDYFSPFVHSTDLCLNDPDFLETGVTLEEVKIAVARRNERIHVKEEEIKRLGEEVEYLKAVETEVYGLCNQTKNLETLLEAEDDMKKATEAKNAELV
ncbi:RNA-directed DNA polymerase, eukaryota, reverse transcriptase zinc-binding domain protein [Tanacetum coccineum]